MTDGLFVMLLGRFRSLGGVELDLPERSTPVRAVDNPALLGSLPDLGVDVATILSDVEAGRADG